jgi:dihydroorotase
MDVVIEGRVLLGRDLVECCIGIEDGKIAKIAKTIGKADRRYDFTGKIIMPAAIDAHVHFREPGMTQKEDFGTGSSAAACGGVSFVLDMPNTRPPTRTSEDVKEKVSLISRKSFVDFGIAALLDTEAGVKGPAKGALAFKIYLGETTGDLGIGSNELAGSISRVTDRPIFIHAEHVKALESRVERNLSDHNAHRSEALEMEAARMVASMKSRNSRVHLLHVTQAGILQLAAESGITAEVTPHHLLLDADSTLGALGKINPPLRSRGARIKLWDAFVSGKADTIGSDHSPHTIEEKGEDFDSAPSGMPGVETLLPLMLQKVAEKKLGLPMLSERCSLRPAQICGLNKGRIEAGCHADLVAVDLRKSIRIHAEKLHSKCGWTPYEGMEAIFPFATFIRGVEVAREGELSGDRIGAFIGPGVNKP